MIFRQLFDNVSGTYTYIVASRHGGEALIIDPVLEKVDRYLQLVRGHCHIEQVEAVFDRGEARLRHWNRLAGHSPGRQ